MAVPIPKYIEKYATSIKRRKQCVEFDLQCPCGCDVFEVYKNHVIKTEEQKKAMNDFEAFVKRCGLRSFEISLPDENGLRYAYRKNIFGRIKDRVLFPQVIESCKIKVKCTHCSDEFIVFDDEKNGYDAISMPVSTLPPVNSVFKQKKCRNSESKFQLHVAIQNEDSLEKFIEMYEEPATEEFYANAFSWIHISGVLTDRPQKNVEILDLETR